jgi:tetratricopeptide (TPR) repeat protein
MKIYVLDTNVLLADPGVLLSFPGAEVVVPETVLAELDKLKTSRVDPDLRFRGREVSRVLFDLSEQGSLTEGVPLPDGGTLRVSTDENGMPEGLSSRNADDRILAVAYRVNEQASAQDEVRLITNDLNMLLKAQTLGVPVARHGEGLEASFTRRYIVRPFQRYRVPLGILAIALAVFAAIVFLVLWGENRTTTASLPPEFKNLLSTPQQTALDYLTRLENNPNDTASLIGMANFYYDQNRQAQAAGDAGSASTFALQGLRYYEKYLALNPGDLDARADYASLLFYNGQSDHAIQEAQRVLADDPNNINALFNLGIFYWQSNRQDLQQAAAQFRKVMGLVKNDSTQHGVYNQAGLNLEAIRKAAATKGITIDATGTLPSGGTQ